MPIFTVGAGEIGAVPMSETQAHRANTAAAAAIIRTDVRKIRDKFCNFPLRSAALKNIIGLLLSGTSGVVLPQKYFIGDSMKSQPERQLYNSFSYRLNQGRPYSFEINVESA